MGRFNLPRFFSSISQSAAQRKGQPSWVDLKLVSTPFGKTTSRLGHSEKAHGPRKDTELGISTCVSELHLANAPGPMLVTELGISTCVNKLHFAKALLPMLVTDLEIFTSVNGCSWQKPSMQWRSRSWGWSLVSVSDSLRSSSLQFSLQNQGSPLASGSCTQQRPRLQCWSPIRE